MAPPRRIALATKNEHKLVEITRICSDWSVEWVTIRDRDPGTFPDVDEIGDTYLDNASLKARAVADALGLPALAGGRSARSGRSCRTNDPSSNGLTTYQTQGRWVVRRGLNRGPR